MAKQLHKKFPTEQVKSLLERYRSREIKIDYILEILGVRRSRFFELLKEYRRDPENFSIHYKRTKSPRRISDSIEKNILAEFRWTERKREGMALKIRLERCPSQILQSHWQWYTQEPISAMSHILELSLSQNYLELLSILLTLFIWCNKLNRVRTRYPQIYFLSTLNLLLIEDLSSHDGII